MGADSLAEPAEGRTPSMYHNIENPWSLRQRLYIPWSGGEADFDQYASIARPHTLVTTDRLYVLYALAKQAKTRQANAAVIECGVYRGGTAAMLAAILDDALALHLYDTFEGMPDVDATRDRHRKGDFADTSLATVRSLLPVDRRVYLHAGDVRETLKDAPRNVALAHIDVDLYRSVLDCCEALYPRMLPGGVMVFDDYGGWDTPGAREAVDEFFSSKPEFPLVLGTGQAMVVKL